MRPTMLLPDIRTVPSLEGVPVLLRVDLNVPVEEGRVLNTFRLEKETATIAFLRRKGAKTILLSHFGRAGASLRPVAEVLSKKIPVSFVPDLLGSRAKGAIAAMAPGEVVLLENVRSDPREEKNDPAFAQELASLGEIFVQDAFAVLHRAHASLVGVPTFLPHYAGLLLQKEVAELSLALSPKSPSLCIIGGAKFETKGPLIEKFLGIYDRVFVGGAIANDVFKAQGYEVGRSRVGAQVQNLSRILNHPRLLLPTDVTVETAGRTSVKKPEHVLPEDEVYDIGPETTEAIRKIVGRSTFILWNGPMGNYERGYTAETEALATAIGKSGAYSIVGGGDTIAAIAKLNLLDRFSFVSTGGGAMMEFLYHGTLPGIEALRL